MNSRFDALDGRFDALDGKVSDIQERVREWKQGIEDFENCNGIEEVALLTRDKQVEESLRLKCGEFLLLLIGHTNGRDRSPMATIHEDLAGSSNQLTFTEKHR
ncbi:hypothetical protein M9H77_30383 [Catharanthus roseus]|uniref:Uncharacterized protein n=1 Tax=Catharanthus roseus TaxID=4058 RepID=A0ACB9ZXZ9_CATRO|nr:hypothetical protein M9H77_30383 [Catharanthus roseus]